MALELKPRHDESETVAEVNDGHEDIDHVRIVNVTCTRRVINLGEVINKKDDKLSRGRRT